jgi:hypothetical protein
VQWDRGRLLLRGVAPEVAAALEIEVVNVATPQSSGALVLFLVAYYGLFAAVIGGMAAALDATAGERERQSPEPLPSVGVPFLLFAVQTNLRSRNGRSVGQGQGSRQGRGRRGTGCGQGRGRYGQ